MQVCECKRCGHRWMPRNREPRCCSKCKSIRWNCSGTMKCNCEVHYARFLIAEAAHAAVQRAVKAGEIPPSSTLQCADCGKSAVAYDHRDYRHPLIVEAVCNSCNKRRSPASWRDEETPSDRARCSASTMKGPCLRYASANGLCAWHGAGSYKRCGATTMNGTPCPFKAYDDGFCVKHRPYKSNF